MNWFTPTPVDSIDLQYTVTPQFVASVSPVAGPRERAERDLQLPVTTAPKQVRRSPSIRS